MSPPLRPSNVAPPRPLAGSVPAGDGLAEAPAELPWLARLGLRAGSHLREAMLTAGFLGQVLLAIGRLGAGRSGMRRIDLLHQLDRCGPQSLPITMMTCALMGLMLAYMGGAQLERIGAPSLVAAVVSVGVVREMAGMMIGVILSGRLAASFAAQLGSMVADEEVDALRAMGVDVIDMLVMPRLVALVVVAPFLWVFCVAAGVLAGLPAALGAYGVPPSEYLNKALTAMNLTHVLIGLFKCVMYTVLLAIAGCRQGLYAGRSTEGVGDATTTAVVKALVWIVVAASLSTVVFQSVGL